MTARVGRRLAGVVACQIAASADHRSRELLRCRPVGFSSLASPGSGVCVPSHAASATYPSVVAGETCCASGAGSCVTEATPSTPRRSAAVFCTTAQAVIREDRSSKTLEYRFAPIQSKAVLRGCVVPMVLVWEFLAQWRGPYEYVGTRRDVVFLLTARTDVLRYAGRLSGRRGNPDQDGLGGFIHTPLSRHREQTIAARRATVPN